MGLIPKIGKVLGPALTILTSQAKSTQSRSHILYPDVDKLTLKCSELKGKRGGTGGIWYSLESGLGKTKLDKMFWEGSNGQTIQLDKSRFGFGLRGSDFICGR